MFTDLTDIAGAKRLTGDRLFAANGIPKYVVGRNKYAESVAGAIAVEAFVDDYTDDETFVGRPVIRMAQLPRECIVVSCVVDGRPLTVLDRLQRARVPEVIDYFTLVRLRPDLFCAVDFSSFNRQDILENESKYAWLHTRLADEPSRRTLEHVTRFRLTGDVEWMRGFSVDFETQYFEDFVRFTAGDVFVDGGGYDGQTTRRFASKCGGYERIYYFEPSSIMTCSAKRSLADLERVSFVSKGLYSSNGIVRFDGTTGPTSHISDTGATEIPVVRLDDEVSEAIMFLKLDVEGAECEALAGAERHIAGDRPQMAVCVYHDQRDFWRVPEKVLQLDDAYDVYLRHYTEGILETVMYFLPRPRC